MNRKIRISALLLAGVGIIFGIWLILANSSQSDAAQTTTSTVYDSEGGSLTYSSPGSQDVPEMYLNGNRNTGQRAWCVQREGHHFPPTGETYTYVGVASPELCFATYYGPGGDGYNQKNWDCGDDNQTGMWGFNFKHAVWILAGCGQAWVETDAAEFYPHVHQIVNAARAAARNATGNEIWYNSASIWRPNDSSAQQLVVAGGAQRGKIKVTKICQSGYGADVAGDFEFKVTIGSDTKRPTLHASSGNSDSWTSDEYDAGTSYSVSETDLPDGWTFVEWSGDARSGTIEAGKTLEIICTNKREPGKIKVTKVCQPGPGADIPADFTFNVTIGGSTTPQTLHADSGHSDSWTSGNYSGGTSYSVSEASLPEGWAFVGWSGDARSGTIQAGKTLEIICTNKRLTGKGKVKKSSTGKNLAGNKNVSTANNSNYNMNGIQYSLYKTQANANAGTSAIHTFTLQQNGESTDTTGELPTGTYYVKETKNHLTGYYRDSTVHQVTIIADTTTTWDVANVPMYGFLSVTKSSASTGRAIPKNGGFTYKLEGNGLTRTVSTNAAGVAHFTDPLPLGTYTITETAAAAPFYQDRPAFNITLKQEDDNGNLVGCTNTSISDSNLRNVYVVGAGDTRTENRQWAFLEVIKKNTATTNNVTKDEFKFEVYRQNANWTLGKSGNRLGVAVTGANAPSRISTAGAAIFMTPDANGNPSTTPAKLPVKNLINANEGYYEVYEVSAAEPFWRNAARYRVTIEADGETGKTKATITAVDGGLVYKNGRPVNGNAIQNEVGLQLSNGPSDLNVVANTTPIEIPNTPYGHIKVIKKNTATATTVTKKEFKFNLYKQNQARNLPHNASNLVGVALTSQGSTNKSGTRVLGEALFMVPDASGNPTTTPAELAVVNYANTNEGYYDIVEVSVAEPFWMNDDTYQVTLKAADNNGKTKSDIRCIGTNPIVFKNGKPVTGNVINDEAGIVVSDCHVAEPTRNQNTTPLEIGDAPYGHIKVIKKNTATAKNVTKKEFKFNLYRQNKARNLPHTAANLVGVALTSQGTTNKSGTQVLGEALFMVPDASGNPTTTPAELAIVNYVYADEGYYDIVEVSVAEPFWKNNDIYQVTLKAANANGLTQSDIGCIGTDPIVFRNGKPVAGGVINNEGGIAVTDCHVAEPTRNQNTTPVEIGDAPYGHIKVIKKNTATAKTVTKKEFKFNLYRQNKARNLPHTAAYLIGVAVTSQGSTNKSGTQVPGEALFMVPDANGNPTTTPVELAIVNYVYADEGYYDIVEASVADPFWLNDDTYQVTLKAADSNGKTKSDIGCIGTNPVVFKNGKPIMGNYIADEMGVIVADCHVAEPTRNENTTPTEIGDAPYAHLKAIKKNVATGGTVTKREFRFALYKQNADRNLARTPANLIGVAVTSNGKTKSGTAVPGEAVFMVPNADGTPSDKPVELPVRNRVYSDEGYYDVYETSVVAPFWPTENRYQVTIDAADNEGATKAAIAVPELTATLFKDGQPVTEIAAEAGIKVPDGTTQAIREQTNTTPIEIGNDQYAYIQVIKKNRELGKSGNTVGQDGFRFKLYDTLANAKNQINWLEEIRTDNTGQARFGTQLPVKGTARTDPSQGNLRVRIKAGEDDNKRNDGVYYVRESGVRYPYNISNTIYRFTITADGDEGIVKYSVSAANFTEHNNEFGDTDWHDYWTNVTTNHAVVSVHDGVVSDLDGPVKNVCDTTLEDAPQYGRATITKRDAEDDSLQRGAEYQVYTLTDVRYVSQGGSFNGTGAANNERTPVPVAFPDTVTAKAPKGYTKKKAPAEDVNTGLQLRHSENTDVVTSTVIDAGGSSWNEGTGAVTVVKPIQFTRADGSTFDTIVTDENGEATTGWLPIDGTGTTTYYLVEVKTSNGRVINGEPIPFTLKINIDTALSEISANPSVVTILQDCESLVKDTDYQNIVNTLQQKDRPNGITIRKTIAKSPANEEGGFLPNATIGFWKEEDDIKVTPEANDGSYSYDAIVIRTSHNTDLRPYVHQRVQGGELCVSTLPEGYRLELTSAESDEEPISVTQTPFTMMTSHDYTVAIYDADDKPVTVKGDAKVKYEEGQRTELQVSGDATDMAVEMTSEAIARRDATVTYRSDVDAWVATDLKAGASYEVEFGRKIVKVIETSENGGHVWFGRYSNGQYDNNHEAMWFNDGWLDQGAMPTHDRCIITSADMSVENANKFTTNTTPLCGTNDDLRTTNHKAWLQDTATQSTYAYEILTSSDGTISHKRIGAGMYVLAEIKPPVDTAHHITWLVDTKPHYFTVDDTTGYIKDTDDTRPEYDETAHAAQAHTVNTTQDFGLVDEVTKLRISKKEASDGDELIGAELILTAGNGDIIDQWISTSEPRYIEGLEPGRYRLTEYMTPKVYEKAESIEFNLLPTGVEQHITMYDSPISIDAEIDKRQEIAFPLDPRDEANGDHQNNAEAQDNELGNYSYSLDFRSKSNTWTDEFTVTDPLEPANDGYANLVSIVTPQAFQDYDGKMNVWYKTNKTDNNYRDLADTPETETPADAEETAEESNRRPWLSYKANATLSDKHENDWLYDDQGMAADVDGDCRVISYDGWRLWEQDIPATVAKELNVTDLNLGEDEIVTGFRFEYGRVEVGFTTRDNDSEDWNRTLLKDQHDDLDDITGLSSRSFQASQTSADAAASRLDILSNRFTTNASVAAEDMVKSSMEQKDSRYDEIAAEIAEHNKTADGVNVLRKFAEAKAIPAYADEGDDIDRLNAATSAAKVSLTSAFILATTPEGRDNILTVAHEDAPADQVFAESPESVEEVKLFREVLLDAARDAIPDLKFMVSDETYALLSEKTEAYATELKRLSGDMAGEDLDVAISEMLSAFLRAVDDINMAGRSGRVLYAPAVIHMQLTKAYTEGCLLRNSADVDAYRNGGNDSTNERSDGKELEGHDHDEVVQTVRRKTNVFIGTLLASTTGEKTVEADGSHNIELIDTVDYHGLVPGTEYVMSGELHLRNRASGATVFSDGGAIGGSQGSTRFIPETPDGTVKVRLVIPAKNFIPQPVVAYEDIRRYDRKSGVAEDIILAEHKDINNQNQTLNLTLPAADLVQTGDLIVPAAVAIVMMAGLGYWAARMRRTRRES